MMKWKLKFTRDWIHNTGIPSFTLIFRFLSLLDGKYYEIKLVQSGFNAGVISQSSTWEREPVVKAEGLFGYEIAKS